MSQNIQINFNFSYVMTCTWNFALYVVFRGTPRHSDPRKVSPHIVSRGGPRTVTNKLNCTCDQNILVRLIKDHNNKLGLQNGSLEIIS